MIDIYLKVGSENATGTEELERITGLSRRIIIKKVEDARRAGVPICANLTGKNHGYFIADNPEDVELYCRSIRKRAGELFKTRRALLKASELMRANQESKA